MLRWPILETSTAVGIGATRGFYNLNFNLATVEPFIGANARYVYAAQVHNSFIAGLVVSVLPQTFVAAQAEYQLHFQAVLFPGRAGAIFYRVH